MIFTVSSLSLLTLVILYQLWFIGQQEKAIKVLTKLSASLLAEKIEFHMLEALK